MLNAAASRSLEPTCGNSDFFASHISATMPNIVTPSAVCTTAAGKARPTSAPAIELADASKASGSASPLGLIAAAAATGLVLAKAIDWRGHAHPRA